MKNMMIIGLILGSGAIVQAMEWENVELGTNKPYSLTETVETFKQEHHDIFTLLGHDQQDNVIKIMQDQRPKLVQYVMTKEGSISNEELIKQYGDDAINFFGSYKIYGSAILSILHDPEFLEKTKKRVQDRSRLQLAVLAQGIESLEAKINKKKKHKKIVKKKDSQTIGTEQEESKNIIFEENNLKNRLKEAFCSEYASLYRVFPYGDEDLVLEKFIDKYPDFAHALVNKQKKTNRFRATPLIDVGQVGKNLIHNSESLTKVYEEYKVLKGLLEASGINVDAIKKAFVQELQLQVNQFAEKIQELDTYVAEKCCTIL